MFSNQGHRIVQVYILQGDFASVPELSAAQQATQHPGGYRCTILPTLGSKNHDQPQVAGYLRITTNPWKALEPETLGSPSGVPVAFGGVDEDASSKNSTNVHRFFEIPHAV